MLHIGSVGSCSWPCWENFWLWGKKYSCDFLNRSVSSIFFVLRLYCLFFFFFQATVVMDIWLDLNLLLIKGLKENNFCLYLTFPEKFCMWNSHLLCVTISLTTIYLQDPIHSNQGSESIDISCCLLGEDNKRRLQDMTNLFKQNRFYVHKTMSFWWY